MIVLRDYQSETVEKVVSLYKANPQGRAKFVWATGLGKTVGFSAIAHEIRQYNDTNVLIIAHRDELLNQAAEKYQHIDPSAVIGKVGGGVFEWGAPVTVASIQTICRGKHLAQLQHWNYGLVIVDEVHHAHKNNEYGKVLAALPDAFKLGVTATDMRLDKLGNNDIFGDAVCTFGIRWGIEQGHLCDLRAIAIKTETMLDKIKRSRDLESGDLDFNRAELSRAIDTPLRNKRVVDGWKEHASDRPSIFFGVTVAHATHVTGAFLEQGIRAAVVSGETQRNERQRLFAALADGSLSVICTVQVLTEGFDLPALSCIIMGRPTQSTGLFMQCIGRGTRLFPGKIDCLILDLTDNCFNHKLEPMTLSKALGLRIIDQESIKEAEEREKTEKAERKARIQKLKSQREVDIPVTLFDQQLPWQERTDGVRVLTFGVDKHRIALAPNPDGSYSVWGKLFPAYESQLWLSHQPLVVAQNYAEEEVRKIIADPKAARWADRSHPSRHDQPSENQIKFLNWKKIPHNPETITKGEASELITLWKMQRNMQDAAKKAKKAQREEKYA